MKTTHVWALCIFLVSSAAQAQSEVFLCTHQDGRREYKNTDFSNEAAGIECKRIDLPGISHQVRTEAGPQKVQAVADRSEWIYVTSDHEKDVYIHRDTIATIAPGVMQAWELWDYKDERKLSDGRKYRSMKMLHTFSCKARKVQLARVTTFTGTKSGGSVVATADITAQKWVNVEPVSTGDVVLKSVCSTQ